MLGKKHREDSKLKASLSQKGKPKNPASILKMRETLTGRKLSDEARAAQSRGKMGMKFSDAHKASIAATKIGRKWRTKDGVSVSKH